MRNPHAIQWILFHGLAGLVQDEQHTEYREGIGGDMYKEEVFTKIAIMEQKLTKRWLVGFMVCN